MIPSFSRLKEGLILKKVDSAGDAHKRWLGLSEDGSQLCWRKSSHSSSQARGVDVSSLCNIQSSNSYTRKYSEFKGFGVKFWQGSEKRILEFVWIDVIDEEFFQELRVLIALSVMNANKGVTPIVHRHASGFPVENVKSVEQKFKLPFDGIQLIEQIPPEPSSKHDLHEVLRIQKQNMLPEDDLFGRSDAAGCLDSRRDTVYDFIPGTPLVTETQSKNFYFVNEKSADSAILENNSRSSKNIQNSYPNNHNYNNVKKKETLYYTGTGYGADLDITNKLAIKLTNVTNSPRHNTSSPKNHFNSSASFQQFANGVVNSFDLRYTPAERDSFIHQVVSLEKAVDRQKDQLTHQENRLIDAEAKELILRNEIIKSLSMITNPSVRDKNGLQILSIDELESCLNELTALAGDWASIPDRDGALAFRKKVFNDGTVANSTFGANQSNEFCFLRDLNDDPLLSHLPELESEQRRELAHRIFDKTVDDLCSKIRLVDAKTVFEAGKQVVEDAAFTKLPENVYHQNVSGSQTASIQDAGVPELNQETVRTRIKHIKSLFVAASGGPSVKSGKSAAPVLNGNDALIAELNAINREQAKKIHNNKGLSILH